MTTNNHSNATKFTKSSEKKKFSFKKWNFNGGLILKMSKVYLVVQGALSNKGDYSKALDCFLRNLCLNSVLASYQRYHLFLYCGWKDDTHLNLSCLKIYGTRYFCCKNCLCRTPFQNLMAVFAVLLPWPVFWLLLWIRMSLWSCLVFCLVSSLPLPAFQISSWVINLKYVHAWINISKAYLQQQLLLMVLKSRF